MEHRKTELKELIDRSFFLLILRCQECGKIVAKIESENTPARLDRTCDQLDHLKETEHSNYEALGHLIIYMNLADKILADQIAETLDEHIM